MKLLHGRGDGFIGMDSSVRDTKFSDIKLVQTTDFFYPLVDDPYMQGRITCANVLSDLYAMGVTDCDNMLMILGIARKMPMEVKEIVTKLLMDGFHDAAMDAGTLVTGGQTVQSPWYTVGGVASSVVKTDEFILPVNAQIGDVLVLTKPLGTQVAVNAHTWLYNDEKYKRVEDIISREEVVDAYETAMTLMARLNRVAAILMKKYDAHAATDVTGFGLLGHAQNLASNQSLKVSFKIHTIPVIRKMMDINNIVNYKLKDGLSAETSGGLLIAMSKESATKFQQEFFEIEGSNSWIIGSVVPALDNNRTAFIVENPEIIDVDYIK